jgi:fermentation-respiration switch protein FrsA (DUF1100 family)
MYGLKGNCKLYIMSGAIGVLCGAAGLIGGGIALGRVARKMLMFPTPGGLQVSNTVYHGCVKSYELYQHSSIYLNTLIILPKQLGPDGFTDKALAKYTHVIVHAHGNAGNVTSRISWYMKLSQMLNMPIVAFDYRGYGLSTGSAHEDNALVDTVSVVHWTQEKFVNSKIVLWGESLGGAMAASAAYRSAPVLVHALVLHHTFAQFADVVPPLLRPVASLLLNPLTTAEWLIKANLPTFIIHADRDEIMTNETFGKLKAAAASVPRMAAHIVQGGHNDMDAMTGLIPQLREFLQV